MTSRSALPPSSSFRPFQSIPTRLFYSSSSSRSRSKRCSASTAAPTPHSTSPPQSLSFLISGFPSRARQQQHSRAIRLAPLSAMAPASLSSARALSLFAPSTRAAASGRWNGLSVPVAAARPVTGASVAVAAAVGRRRLVAAAAATEMAPAASGEEGKPFVDEMRAVAMRLHTKDQAREGEKEPQAPPVAKWEPSVQGYLRFLVDSRLVFKTLEDIVQRAAVPWYAEFRNTGLERSEALKKDLEWFKQQGHTIPEPSAPGTTYASYLEELSEKDPQAFICHFYNVYFAHTAGGRMIGKKVAEKILNKKELEFYKWEGNLSQLLQNVRNKLNQVASSWSREEKDHCLEETEKSFAYSGDLLRHIFT